MTLEEEHLAQADRHIAEAEARTETQQGLLARLRTAGGDVAEAEELLATMEQSLSVMREHRRLVLAGVMQERTGSP